MRESSNLGANTSNLISQNAQMITQNIQNENGQMIVGNKYTIKKSNASHYHDNKGSHSQKMAGSS